MTDLRKRLAHHLRKLGEYNSSLVAATAATSAVLAAVLGLGGFLPDEAAAWATTATASLAAASAFLVRYQDKIDDAGDELADLIDGE